ncbi:MAG TPA: hypothetical protein VHZ73_10275 [Vicinamibacterales bacterium]|nr:hypothetical protein [Vicinamibacterales bacterium]
MLNPSRFVVLGEWLASGMANFSLFEDDQRESFAALLARQMSAELPQPFIQPPGIGHAAGFPVLPVRLPYDHQTTVLAEFPPAGPISNLSVPGLTVADAVTLRPAPPLVDRSSQKQTAVNFILGMPGLLNGDTNGLPTQLEYALARKPSFALIVLGFAEVMEAAAAASPDTLPDLAAFRANYTRIVTELRASGCDVIVATIPDPMDTAAFSQAPSAARNVKLPLAVLEHEYNLKSGDRLTVNGLMEVGYRVMAKDRTPLPAGSILPGAVASKVSIRVRELNAVISSIALEHGATVHDLAALFRRVKSPGASTGGRTLTADFLGGFYSLNGYTPGRAGHALIANDLLDTINRAFGTSFARVDVSKIVEKDAVASYLPAPGPDHHTLTGYVAGAVTTFKTLSTMVGFVAQVVKAKIFGGKGPAPAASGSTPAKWTLKLPASMEQELPINKAASYYGDALRAIHTTSKEEAAFGLSGKLLFGGLALLDTHLSGTVKIRFAPPVNNVTHFEVSHGTGMKGDVGRLSAPQFFILPAIDNQVMDAPDVVSSGDLDLITGLVTNLKYEFFFLNTAILSLAAVNPTLPKAALKFPGEYGSTWAKFEQRPDGLLDYTCYASTFIPLAVLNVPIRFPLPFVGPSGDYASIPSDGTQLHPHIRVSTKPLPPADPGVTVPHVPTNTIVEFGTSTHNTSFGDDFSLNAPELGGRAYGRSHLTGRFQIQFGERFGDSVAFAVLALPPAGLLRTLVQSPIAEAFKVRVPDGLMGHDEPLIFPNSTYSMNDITYLDDPLEVSLGVIDTKTGKIAGPLLRRGIITTNWLLAMLRLETRTPKSTFMFRGDAAVEGGVNGQLVFRYDGKLNIPFPAGFFFPAADLEHTIVIGPDSALDPFVRWQAMSIADAPPPAVSGAGDRIASSNGDVFSYRYEIHAGGKGGSFEYTNHTRNKIFTMLGVAAVNVINSRTSSAGPGEHDTVSFAGTGTWSDDPGNTSHIATVQVCTSKQFPYVSILVDGNRSSSVNTKPVNVADTLP